ncbi:MAG: AAA family ATPase [Candidatus Promineifilaceae bacterium]|nr:AAA family ATPase [Candidatus Promineifilaceae bacterium]
MSFVRLSEGHALTEWQTAAALYRGPFLDGFVLRASREFDRWLSQAQREFEQIFLSTLRKLIVNSTIDRDTAISYAQRYLAVDELAEDVHRQLIRLFAAAGDRSAARSQYERCLIVLERELGVQPLPETKAVYDAARKGVQVSDQAWVSEPRWTTLPGLGLTLVGRDAAWHALEEHTGRFKNGGAIFISGEPGIGKSRLVQEFASNHSELVLTGSSHATGQALPYQSIVQALRSALPLHERWAAIPSIWLAQVSRLLPEISVQFPALSLPAVQSQAHLFEALAHCFAGLAGDSSLLLCLDDVHWSDEGTLAWLQYMASRLGGSGICILATYRTTESDSLAEWRRELRRSGRVADVLLDGLSESAVAALIDEAGINPAMTASLAGRIHAATGGNAFFVIETIRELQESNRLTDKPTSIDLPLSATIREVVLGRTDRLSPLARQIAAALAVLAPLSTLDIVTEVSGRTEFEVEKALKELVAHQLLAADEHGFRFQHELGRQVIYEDIDAWRQRLLHERAAKGLEKLYAGDLDAHYPSLAYHWSQVVAKTAPMEPTAALKAAHYLHGAGEQAMLSSSDTEAIAYFNQAIKLIQSLPETAELNRRELELQIALYAPLGVARGYGAPEVAGAFNRARELSERVGQPEQLFLVLYGLWGLNLTQGKLQRALDLTQQCLSLAESVDNQGLLMEAYRLRDETQFFRGEFSASLRYLEQGYALYDPQQHRNHATVYAQDPGVAFLSYKSWLRWILGYPDQAQLVSQKALAHAQDLSHLGSQAYALSWAAAFQHMLGDVQKTKELAERAIILSVEQGFTLFLGVGITLQGWAQAKSGQTEEGLERIQQGLDDVLGTGAKIWLTNGFALLAEAHVMNDQVEKGLLAVDKALALVEEHGERWWEAELHRLRGEFLRKKGAPGVTVEEELRRAIGVAKEQNARLLELRAIMSLSRLWQAQDKRVKAHQILTEIYARFTEGFSTADLRAAHRLINNLA